MTEKNFDLGRQIEDFYLGFENGLRKIAQKSEISYGDFLKHKCRHYNSRIFGFKKESISYVYKPNKNNLEITVYCACGKYANAIES